ncbi:MAG: response regulator [Deltaproteobacteria bacterium CSP1-8]|nr:MAG: response regulator [Deltaproteobacteria bacterium CSP1-8]
MDGDSEKPPHEILSDREYQVMLMIASGKPVGTIAKELCLSVKTISSYRANILLVRLEGAVNLPVKVRSW